MKHSAYYLVSTATFQVISRKIDYLLDSVGIARNPTAGNGWLEYIEHSADTNQLICKQDVLMAKLLSLNKQWTL